MNDNKNRMKAFLFSDKDLANLHEVKKKRNFSSEAEVVRSLIENEARKIKWK